MASVVLVHGAWHGPWCWDDVAEALAQRGHDVSTVMLPGHDMPGTRRRIWNRMSEYVEAVASAARSASTSPVLVGHSMGSYAVQLHLETGDAACGVLVASVPASGTLRANLRALRRHPAPTLKSFFLFDYSYFIGSDELVRNLFFSDATPPEVVARCRSRLQNESPLALNLMSVRRPRARHVSVPMHVIGATRDAVFTVDEQHRLAAAYGVEAEFLDGGHDLMLDRTWPLLVDRLDAIAQQAPTLRTTR